MATPSADRWMFCLSITRSYRQGLQGTPKRWSPVKKGVCLLATRFRTSTNPSLPIRNRFRNLELEEPAIKVDDNDDSESVEIRNATQCYVSNVSVKSTHEHDLFQVEGKVNGCRAVMHYCPTAVVMSTTYRRQCRKGSSGYPGRRLIQTTSSRDNPTIESHRQRLL